MCICDSKACDSELKQNIGFVVLNLFENLHCVRSTASTACGYEIVILKFVVLDLSIFVILDFSGFEKRCGRNKL